MDESSQNLKLDIRKEFEDYKKFALSKSLLDTAVALVMATAVQKMVNGVVDCVLMPVLNYFIGGTDANWRTRVWEPMPGMAISIGDFTGRTVDFIIISVAMYILYVRVKKMILPDDNTHAN